MQNRRTADTRPHLLVVDDEPDMGTFITDVAEMIGLRVLRHFQKPIRLAELHTFLQHHFADHGQCVERRQDDQSISADDL
jgi:hypothetical protein